MAIVSGGLFKTLKHTKANMNHPMDEKLAAANDAPMRASGLSPSARRAKISLKKSV